MTSVEQMIEQIATNPWAIVASYILAILGFIAAFVFYYLSKEKFEMAYRVCERTLLSSKNRWFDMDIPVLLDGRELIQFTRSYVLILNVGNKLIEPKDIVGSLAIKTINDASIIRAEVVGTDDPGSQAQIVAAGQMDGMRELRFDFLRPTDAFIVKIDHTGSTNELFLECNTKAGGAIRDPSADAPMGAGRFTALLFLLGLIGGAIVLIVGGNGRVFMEGSGAERYDLLAKSFGLAMMLLIPVVFIIGPALNYLFKRFVVGTYRKGPTDDLWQKIQFDWLRF